MQEVEQRGRVENVAVWEGGHCRGKPERHSTLTRYCVVPMIDLTSK
jgi:hypothetical protein